VVTIAGVVTTVTDAQSKNHNLRWNVCESKIQTDLKAADYKDETAKSSLPTFTFLDTYARTAELNQKTLKGRDSLGAYHTLAARLAADTADEWGFYHWALESTGPDTNLEYPSKDLIRLFFAVTGDSVDGTSSGSYITKSRDTIDSEYATLAETFTTAQMDALFVKKAEVYSNTALEATFATDAAHEISDNTETATGVGINAQ